MNLHILLNIYNNLISQKKKLLGEDESLSKHLQQPNQPEKAQGTSVKGAGVTQVSTTDTPASSLKELKVIHNFQLLKHKLIS